MSNNSTRMKMRSLGSEIQLLFSSSILTLLPQHQKEDLFKAI